MLGARFRGAMGLWFALRWAGEVRGFGVSRSEASDLS